MGRSCTQQLDAIHEDSQRSERTQENKCYSQQVFKVSSQQKIIEVGIAKNRKAEKMEENSMTNSKLRPFTASNLPIIADKTRHLPVDNRKCVTSEGQRRVTVATMFHADKNDDLKRPTNQSHTVWGNFSSNSKEENSYYQIKTAQSGEIRRLSYYPLNKVEYEKVNSESISLDVSPISLTYIKMLTDQNSETFNLENHEIGPSLTAILRKDTSTTIKHIADLNLSGNNLGDEGAEQITNLFANTTCLKKLDLSSNGVGSSGIIALSNLLHSNRTITDIVLAKNELSDTDVDILLSALDVNDVLSCLDISGNKLSSESGQYIGDFLSTNTTLETLNIERNDLGPDGTLLLFEGLQTNSGLKVLNVADNQIKDEGIEQLSNLASLGGALETLDLSDNLITTYGVKRFAKFLDKYSPIKQLKLNNNLLDQTTAIFLLQTLIDFQNSTLVQIHLKGVFADDTVKGLFLKLKKINNNFAVVGTYGSSFSGGTDPMRTLENYLRRNGLKSAMF